MMCSATDSARQNLLAPDSLQVTGINPMSYECACEYIVDNKKSVRVQIIVDRSSFHVWIMISVFLQIRTEED